MAINDISLSASMRQNLIELQSTVNLMSRTQNRLSSGKKVNTALDNPISYFAADGHKTRANDISTFKDMMSEGIQTIQNANNGITAIKALIENARGQANAALATEANRVTMKLGSTLSGTATITVAGQAFTATTTAGGGSGATFEIAYADSARTVTDWAATAANFSDAINRTTEASQSLSATVSGTTVTVKAYDTATAITQYSNIISANTAGVTYSGSVIDDRKVYAEQYNTLMRQVDSVANTAGYRGKNLLQKGELLTVNYEGGSVSVNGFDARASEGLSLRQYANSSTSKLAWATADEISSDVEKLETALGTLKNKSVSLSTSLSAITIQQDYSTNKIKTLTEGADNLTLADMNEEGANMLMLQTQQNLGITTLSMASQSAQAVLRLF